MGAVSSAGRGSPTPTIKLLRAFRHGEFYSYQSTGLTRGRTKMTISCDIPTQMIVDDSSSSSSSPEQTNNLAEAMKARRRKKKKRSPMVGNTFTDLYKLTGQSLGEGSYGKVENCVNVFTGIEYAVKIIEKVPGFFNRSKILKEIEIYHLCRGQENIIQLIEYFEEPNCFDLCSAPISIDTTITPTLLSPVGSLEYMAPEVVDTFLIDDYDDDDDESICYNKKCDLWSLGVIMYILLCGYAPFSGNCGLDCGWDRGESCTDCQERLFSSIKEGRLVFPDQHWSTISPQAKDLIKRLLVKDSGARLDANQVLDHPWVLYGGNSNNLMTPTILRRQTSIKDLEDFASRAMAVNRAVGANSMERMEPVQVKRAAFSFDLSPPNLSNCGLMARRRRSKENFQRFCSIDEVEPDAFMRTIH